FTIKTSMLCNSGVVLVSDIFDSASYCNIISNYTSPSESDDESLTTCTSTPVNKNVVRNLFRESNRSDKSHIMDLNQGSCIFNNAESIPHFTYDISTFACPESNLQHKSDAESFADCTSTPVNKNVVRHLFVDSNRNDKSHTIDLNEDSLIYDNAETIPHFTDDISTLACPESNLQHKS
ncbi:hypothetical protein CBL_20953, partial [Carabus blaptoides fortunei]